jgi:hypothetical protein
MELAERHASLLIPELVRNTPSPFSANILIVIVDIDIIILLQRCPSICLLPLSALVRLPASRQTVLLFFSLNTVNTPFSPSLPLFTPDTIFSAGPGSLVAFSESLDEI